MPGQRFHLVLDGPRLDGWQARVVDGIEAAGGEVTAIEIVVGDRSGAARPTSGPAAVLQRKLARALAGPAKPAAISARLPRLAGADQVTHAVLDLRSEPGSSPATSAPLGVWRFRFDDSTSPLDAIGRTVLSGAATMSVRLERDGQVQRAGVFGLSAEAPWSGVAALAATAAQWPMWCVARVAEATRPAPFGTLPNDLHDRVEPHRTSPLRRAGQAAVAVARKALWAEVWTVGVARSSVADLLAGGVPGDLHWLPERGPRGAAALWRHRQFAADPFLYRTDDGPRCLHEALDHGSGRGWIDEVPVGDTSTASPSTVFRSEWHWSYPYVFEDGGVTYCIPETADAGATVLYRVTSARFEPVTSLLPGLPVLDPSVVKHDGRYWLFCTMRDGALLNTALHLFVADSLTGPYRPHPDNPVKLDVRSARPAGAIVTIDGVLHRPGQDCGADYGAALVLHRIDELSEVAYRETAVGRVEPAPAYPSGLHTLSECDGWVAVDGRRYAFSPPLLVSRLRRLSRRR